MSESTVRIQFNVESGQGEGRDGPTYKAHSAFYGTFVPAVGNSVTLDDGVERTVVKLAWGVPDLVRSVNIFLDDPTVSERYA